MGSRDRDYPEKDLTEKIIGARNTSAKCHPGTLPEKEGTHWAATAPFLRTASSAPKGRTMVAQGEALGNGCGPSAALKGRTNHPTHAVG